MREIARRLLDKEKQKKFVCTPKRKINETTSELERDAGAEQHPHPAWTGLAGWTGQKTKKNAGKKKIREKKRKRKRDAWLSPALLYVAIPE